MEVKKICIAVLFLLLIPAFAYASYFTKPSSGGGSHGDGANCAAGLSPAGVDANGAVQGCFDVATQTEFDTHTSNTSNPHSVTAAQVLGTLAGLILGDGLGGYSAITDNSSNWNTAFGWGDHSAAGYQAQDALLDLIAALADPGADRILAWDEAPTNGFVFLDYAAWDMNASDDFSGSWNDLADIPAGFSDGVDNTGTDSADDLSDNQVGDLSDVDETGADSGEALVSDGAGNWSPSASPVCLSNGTNCPADDDVPEVGDFDALVGGRSLTYDTTNNQMDADAELYEQIFSINIPGVTTSDTNKIQHKFSHPITIARVSCSTDTGTVTIQLDERAEATPNTAGTDVLSSALVCDDNTEATTSFGNASIAADVPLNLQITATSGTPGVVRIHVDRSVND